LSLVIATTVLKDGEMAIPGALYGVMMYAGGLMFAWVMRRYVARPSRADRVSSAPKAPTA
jgi:BASS family bile acid:Na+ symporter